MRFIKKQINLSVEPAAPLGVRKSGIGAAEIHLVDDREHRDFKKNRMKPGTLDADINAERPRRIALHRDVLALEVKETQKLNEVRLHKAQIAQIFELVVFEVKTAEVVNLRIDLINKGRQVDVGRAALEAVGHFRRGKLMQHALLHREFIEVRVEKRLNDHVRPPWPVAL